MDHSDNTLAAAIKALEEVVAPAIDPADPLAAEQVTLVIDSLGFLRERLDHLHDRARFELRHHLTLAHAVAEDAAGALDEEVEVATAVYERAGARMPELRASATSLAAALRTLVRDAANFDDITRRRIERRIVAGSRERIEADRAWHLPQGFDPDPSNVAALELALEP
jgi:ABC-type transporter Mla subunit MlaD